MSIQDIMEQVMDMTERHVRDNMTNVEAEQLGLDRRAAYRLYVDDDCIAVDAGNDRTLQYYGGFEYVSKEYRTEMGGYVFYSREDDRVNDHLQQYQESLQDAE